MDCVRSKGILAIGQSEVDRDSARATLVLPPKWLPLAVNVGDKRLV